MNDYSKKEGTTERNIIADLIAEKVDPNQLEGSARAFHIMYTGFMKAGFTEEQAMQILIAWMNKTT